MKYFFFNDTATTEIYTLSLHDALPISGELLAGDLDAERVLAGVVVLVEDDCADDRDRGDEDRGHGRPRDLRSEEHTSELQSRQYLVCRLLLEKKNHQRTVVAYCLPLSV